MKANTTFRRSGVHCSERSQARAVRFFQSVLHFDSVQMSELVEPAPEHCPGPASQAAGNADACAGCPNQQICKTAPKGPDPGKSYHAASFVSFFLYLLPNSIRADPYSFHCEAYEPRNSLLASIALFSFHREFIREYL